MIQHKIFITILLLTCSLTGYGQDQLIKMDSKEIALESVFQYLESNHGFLISYKEDDIVNVKVIPHNKTSTIDVFLKKSLETTGLEFEILQKKYIVISKRSPSQNEILDESLLVSELCGRVVDQLSGEPLSFANVYLPKTKDGVMTNEDGTFKIKTKIDLQDSVVISYVGFQEKKILASQLKHQPCQIIELDLFEYSEDFVVVLDYLTDGVALNDNGAFTNLKPQRISSLPGQAEPDVLKTIQFLPGISSPDRSASGIHIRGGTPDQNLVLWEDIPLYHTAHYFGMVSAINPFIIDEAKVFRGGFNAEYGGRVSGVIDMKSSNNTNTKNDFTAGSNLINAYANGKVSLLKNKVALVFSVRRAFSDLWQTPTFKDITTRIQESVLYQLPNLVAFDSNIRFDNKFHFFDSNLKAIFNISEKDKISAAYFYGNNDFQSTIFDENIGQEQNDSLYLSNMGASLKWTHKWSSKFSTKITGVISDFRYDYQYKVLPSGQNQNDKFGIKKSNISEQQINLLTTYKLPFKQKFKLGYQLANYDVSFKITKDSRNNNQVNQNKKYHSLLHVVYGSWNTNQEKKWGVETGLRASYYEDEKDFFIEPRVRLWYRLFDHFNLYFNTGKYYQFLSQLIELEGDRASIKTPVWVLTGDKEVPILDATQHQFGFLFEKNNWVVDVQTYSKNINGLTSLAIGFGEDLSGKFHVGEAKIKGLDILLKKRWKNYRSWISYSYGRIDHQFETFFDSDFLSPNDQTHVLDWINMLKYKNWEFSLGWKYSSGTPYSLRQNFQIRTEGMGMDTKESLEPLVYEFNSGRLSSLHHLDASILYSFYTKNKKCKGIVGLSLFNIYSQRNTYQRAFFIESNLNSSPTLNYTDKTDVGFMPNFMVRFEW